MYTKNEYDCIVTALKDGTDGSVKTPKRLAAQTMTRRAIVNAVLFQYAKTDPKAQYVYRSPYNVRKYKRPAWIYSDKLAKLANNIGSVPLSELEKEKWVEDLVSSLPDTLV